MEYIITTMRLEPNMRKSIEKVSADNRRSMNQQLIVILDEWLKAHGYAPWPPSKKEKRK